MDDVLALQALIELSNTLNPEKQCQLDDVKFPLLDKDTVESAMGSVVYILENKPKWRTSCTNLVKKWCDVRDESCRHLPWMGTDSSLPSTDCLLAACQILVDQNSKKNLLYLERQQQEAACMAILCLVDKTDKARKLSTKLFEFIMDHCELIEIHTDFLAEIWKLRGILRLPLKQIELIILKCPCGLERELLNIATNSIENNSSETDSFGNEEDDTSLITLCKSSPVIFQVTTSMLMLLVQTSQAHQNVLNVLIDFVQRCIIEEQNIITLFPVKCQVPLALLSIPPEQTDLDSFVVHLLDALSELPVVTSALLVILHPCWIPYLVDKLL